MIKFKLFHGRLDPEEDMTSAGFDGPVIECDAIQCTYDTVRLIFEDHRLLEKWKNKLGWDLSTRGLEVRRHQDMVKITDPSGLSGYYVEYFIES